MNFLEVIIETGTLNEIGRGHAEFKEGDSFILDNIEIGESNIRNIRTTRYIYNYLDKSFEENCTLGFITSFGKYNLLAIKNDEGKFYKENFFSGCVTDRALWVFLFVGFAGFLFTFGLSSFVALYGIFHTYRKYNEVILKVQAS
jgi:hypothetical protein